MRRTQIYLSDKETDALSRAARETGRSRSELIREAIRARYLARPDPAAVERALRRSAGSWKGRSEDGEEYVEQLRRGRLSDLHAR